MARALCTACGQPQATCLCEFITPVNHRTSVVIIQCGKESRHAKNTANLLPFLSSNISIIHDSDNEKISALREYVTASSGCALLFPSSESKSIASYMSESSSVIEKLIVIDGTWRKAKRFCFENSWLTTLPALHLSKDYESLYTIRKTSVKNGLSTLEAIAYSLKEIEQVDTEPFLQLLIGINTVFTKHMPENVKNRYE